MTSLNRRVLTALAIFFALPLVAAAPSLDTLVKACEDPQLGPAHGVTSLKLQIGHLELRVESGVASPVMMGESQIGIFVSGSGEFVYETANSDEFTAVRYNTHNTGVALGSAKERLSIGERFTSALIYDSEPAALPEADQGGPEASLSEHQNLFARARYLTPASHDLAMQALSNTATRVAYAEIRGTDHPFIYRYDAADQRQEILTVLHPPHWRTNSDRNDLYESLLSSQPIDRTPREYPPLDVILEHVDVNLVASAGEEATLSVTETLVPQRAGIGVIRFQLYDEYRFDVNKEPRHYRLRSVMDGEGRKLSFHHQAGDLLVALPQPAPAGKPLDLHFEIDGNFLYRPEGSHYWELGIEPWFPWTRWDSQRYTYHSLVKVKKPFVPFGSGKTIRREEEGDYNVLETSIEQPVSCVAILAGKYQFDEETRSGVTVRVASFLSKNPEAWKTLQNLAFSAIEYYPYFLGPFPFDEITIVEKNDLGYGQAPAGLVFITREAFQPKFADANQYVEGINMRFAHELAHQYWGQVVKMASFEDQWIEESFADYSAALFMKAGGREKDYHKALATWKRDAARAGKTASIPMANRIKNPSDRLEQRILRQQLVYSKGALLLAALHDDLGEEKFLTFMKSYQASFRWKLGTTGNAVALLNFITKQDYGPFFEKYFYGTEVPKL